MEWNTKTDEEITHAEKQACFYKYFVPNCQAYITYNININTNLANGTLIRQHSLELTLWIKKILTT